jgi:hypothetical protein
MIQFRRGKTSSWKNASTPLADGQPGYDKDRHKIKIGDGKTSWEKLPDASGLRLDEILDSESNARDKVEEKNKLGLLGAAIGVINPIAGLIAIAASKLSPDDRPVFTYGEEAPSESTVGQVYLQCFDAKPETDYVIESLSDDIWTYRKWKSGKAECWGTFTVSTPVATAFENVDLYCNHNAILGVSYPFEFKSSPKEHCETATLTSQNMVAWLASVEPSTTTKSAKYRIISPHKSTDGKEFKINLHVEGLYKE